MYIYYFKFKYVPCIFLTGFCRHVHDVLSLIFNLNAIVAEAGCVCVCCAENSSAADRSLHRVPADVCGAGGGRLQSGRGRDRTGASDSVDVRLH